MRLDNVPIFSMLKSADGLCHKRSLAELIISLFFAWSPLLIKALIDYILKPVGFFASLYSSLNGVEIYIYICTILGALVYLIFDFGFRSKGFKHSAGFTLSIVILAILTMIIHVLGLLKVIPEDAQGKVQVFAILIYAISVLLWWLSIVYRNIPDPALPDLDRPGRDKRKQMQDSLEDYEE